MHVLRLRIILQSGDRELLDKRFRIMNRIHNVIVSHAFKLLRILRRNKEYKALLKEYHAAEPDSNERKAVGKKLDAIRGCIGLTNNDIEKFAAVQAAKYRNHLSSQQVQKEADRVWQGVEKVLYSNGKRIHYRKLRDMTTICGKSETNGIQLYAGPHDFLPKKVNRNGLPDGFLWCGRYFSLRIDHDDPYIKKSIKGKVAYCEIKRLAFNDGWRYYLNIYLRGKAPLRHAVGDNETGIDYGTSTVAAFSGTKAFLRELAPLAPSYEKEIYRLQRRIDRSKRMHNPDNYNQDGTIKKGRHKWAITKNCKRLQQRLRTLHRKEAAYRKQSHEELANELLAESSGFTVEPMDFSALAKRAKETKRSDKASVVHGRDGAEKTVYKYKRKKRFGHSIHARAPGMFVEILKRKRDQYDLKYREINPWKFKASQYDHEADKCIKCELKDRGKIIGGKAVQRDLYSAFLIRNTDGTLEHPDRDKCIKGFDDFVKVSTREIETMKSNGISRRECFGF